MLIITYGCAVLTPERQPVVSHEHKEVGLFAETEVPSLVMPDGYKRSIAAQYAQLVPAVDDGKQP